MEYEQENTQTRFDSTTGKNYQNPCGRRYTEATLSKLLVSTEDSTRMFKWLSNKANMFVYMGNVGCGKTYFCMALYNYAQKNRLFESFRYWNERELLSRVKMDMEYGDYQQHLKLLTDDHLVILDDIGSAEFGDWGKKVIFDLIDMRYSSMLPTVITTNLSERGFLDVYGERTASRIFSKENTLVEIRDEDFRQRLDLLK